VALLEGPELPILDGGARTFADALARLEIPSEPPALLVRRRATFEHEGSSYEFEPGDAIDIVVETMFDHPGIGHQSASWGADLLSFRDEIATARTFGFTADACLLWQRGRAQLASRALGGDEAAAKTIRQAVLSFDPSSD